MKNSFVGPWIFTLCIATAYPPSVGANIDAPVVDKTKKAPAAAPLSDKQILTFVYLENAREIKADQWAQVQAESDEVRDMAKDFRKDHAFIAKEVRALAGRLGVKLRDGSDISAINHKKTALQRGRINDLQHLQGAEFDSAYKKIMTKSHEDVIQFMEQQRVLLPKDSPVYDMLGTLLPKVHDHYDILSSTGTESDF